VSPSCVTAPSSGCQRSQRWRSGGIYTSSTPSTRRLTRSFAHRSKGGSSDPRCTLTVSGTELKAQSSTKQKTLEPRWCEVFSFEYTPGSDSENPPVLDVLVEDVDQLTSADFMGRARVELEPLKNQRLRKWFPLSADSEGKKGSSNVTGDLELVVQWRHNPALAFAPFADAVEDVPEGKKPNELRVAAIQARRLAVKDKSMMGKGTSDPVVTFELGSVKAETTVKKKTLNPTWKEAFAKPCSVEEAQDCQLKISVGDWDAVTSRDFMGSCTVHKSNCGGVSTSTPSTRRPFDSLVDLRAGRASLTSKRVSTNRTKHPCDGGVCWTWTSRRRPRTCRAKWRYGTSGATTRCWTLSRLRTSLQINRRTCYGLAYRKGVASR
jgi:hypothetical protein